MHGNKWEKITKIIQQLLFVIFQNIFFLISLHGSYKVQRLESFVLFFTHIGNMPFIHIISNKQLLFVS